MRPPKKLLTIGGSDSGGAAGIQADLKTWTALGGYGMSVITAVTAQNSVSVEDVAWMTPEMVVSQLTAVLTDYGADAIKTGFLGRVALITAVAQTLRDQKAETVIIDPVLVNHKGQSMFPDAVRQAYLTHLLPLASMISPNLAEAALLADTRPLTSYQQVRAAAQTLVNLGARTVLIKGFRDDNSVLDLLFDGRTFTDYQRPFLRTANTHGSGDTLSAALGSFLAEGVPLETAVDRAIDFTHQAIQKAAHWRLGAGHGPVWHPPALS